LLDLRNLFAGGTDKRGQALPRFLPQQAQPGAGADGGLQRRVVAGKGGQDFGEADIQLQVMAQPLPIASGRGCLRGDPAGEEPAYSFPGFARLAEVSESDLRGCKLGFRAPYLRGTAQKLAAGEVDLGRLHGLSLDEARAELLQLPGVGVKIADCVLLFAYGFAEAFPVDVWILRALRRHYFPRLSVSPARLRRFIRAHFGPRAGYAQQYLFHYIRVIEKGK